MADEIVKVELKISYEKVDALKEYHERLQNLFGVSVAFDSPHNACSAICWINLKGQKTDVDKAKIYIQSFCDPENKVCLCVPDSFFVELREYTIDVERDSRAVVTFPSREEVLIQGSELAVAMASSMIDQKLCDLKSERRNPVPSRRPVLEMDPALKEFAIKLGYPEQDIVQVVRKRGADVDQNTLLHELIKLSSQRMQLSAQVRQNTDREACSGVTAGSNTSCVVRSFCSPPRSSEHTLYAKAASSPCLVKQHALKRASAQDGQGLTQGPNEEREQKSDRTIDDDREPSVAMR